MTNFKKDMINKYGIDLENGLDNITTEAFYTRIRDILILDIQTCNPNFDEEEIKNEPFLYKAILEQAYYTINNADFSQITGIDFQTGTIIPLVEIRKRDISPISKRILMNAGFYYTGLGNIETDTYRFNRGL